MRKGRDPMFRIISTMRTALSFLLKGLKKPEPELLWNLDRAREFLIKTAAHHGFGPNSDTLAKQLENLETGARHNMVMSVSDIGDRLNPRHGSHVEAIALHDGGVMINTMANYNGVELVAEIAKAWVGYRIALVAKVIVKSHTTLFLDSTDNVIVGFYGSGRKAHHSDTFRAQNAVDALKLVGIIATIEEIALPDMRHFYEPLVYERQPGGAWSVHVLDAVAG